MFADEAGEATKRDRAPSGGSASNGSTTDGGRAEGVVQRATKQAVEDQLTGGEGGALRRGAMRLFFHIAIENLLMYK